MRGTVVMFSSAKSSQWRKNEGEARRGGRLWISLHFVGFFLWIKEFFWCNMIGYYPRREVANIASWLACDHETMKYDDEVCASHHGDTSSTSPMRHWGRQPSEWYSRYTLELAYGSLAHHFHLRPGFVKFLMPWLGSTAEKKAIWTIYDYHISRF